MHYGTDGHSLLRMLPSEGIRERLNWEDLDQNPTGQMVLNRKYRVPDRYFGNTAEFVFAAL
jgi:hypothetical protein